MSNSSNFKQRVITGLIGTSIFVFGVCFNEYSYFLITFLLLNLCVWEFLDLVKKIAQPSRFLTMFLANSLLFLSYGISRNSLPTKYLAVLIVLFCTVFFLELFRKKEVPFINIAFTFLSIIYIAIPVSLIHFTTFVNGEYHYEIMLGIILLLWTSDSFAYFTGRLVGKTKLFERISPKKTWEGSLGSLVFAVGMAFGLNKFFPIFELQQWIIMAVIIVICGGLGDLVESLLKRSFDIKDSGTILPGHGGFLDRFDGLFLSIPFITTYLVLFE